MKVIGLDVGDKTIGVALSDDLNITAQGLMTINRVGIRKDTSKVIELVKQYDCETIVIGLPLNLDGTDSIQTEKVREFTDLLKNKLRSSGKQKIDVVFQDERFSTVIAENVLIEADLSRKKRKDVIDTQAATVILQSYLDTMKKGDYIN